MFKCLKERNHTKIMLNVKTDILELINDAIGGSLELSIWFFDRA